MPFDHTPDPGGGGGPPPGHDPERMKALSNAMLQVTHQQADFLGLCPKCSLAETTARFVGMLLYLYSEHEDEFWETLVLKASQHAELLAETGGMPDGEWPQVLNTSGGGDGNS